MAMLFLYVREGGFSKLEVTPGGGFKAGVGDGMTPDFVWIFAAIWSTTSLEDSAIEFDSDVQTERWTT